MRCRPACRPRAHEAPITTPAADQLGFGHGRLLVMTRRRGTPMNRRTDERVTPSSRATDEIERPSPTGRRAWHHPAGAGRSFDAAPTASILPHWPTAANSIARLDGFLMIGTGFGNRVGGNSAALLVGDEKVHDLGLGF